MTESEARHILGLGPAEDPRLHLRELRVVREGIAELVRSEADEALAARYQQGLMDFDKALAAVREHLEALGEATAVPAVSSVRAVPTASVTGRPVAAVRVRHRRRAVIILVWLLILLLGAAAAGWVYLKLQDEKRLQSLARIALLEGRGAAHVETRRWGEASAAFDEIEQLAPGSQLAALGRRSIEAGMAEEQQQFAGYWIGQAQASLEAGRWDEAASAARQVLEKSPADRESLALLGAVAVAREAAARGAAITAAQEQLGRQEWEAAIGAATAILATQPNDPDARAILGTATSAKTQAAAGLARARSLCTQAVARDQGQFDQQALDRLREASVMAPGDATIAAQLEKMASYTRTLRVPRDFPTPTEALANARDGDRIILSEGTWKGPLNIDFAIELQGAGADKTRIECPADAGCAITVGPAASGTRLSGLSLRHESQAIATERFSAGLIRGAAVDLSDCQFIDASGHGLAVIEGGKVHASRCRFVANGWDGAAAMGAGSVLEIADSQATGNFEHGIESWDGAAVVLVNNRCEGNSRNGIHADNPKANATVEGNQLIGNREFGLVLAAAGSGHVRNNSASGNLLGGFVIGAASRIAVSGNQIRRNQGPGLTLEKGLDASAFADNTLSGNSGKQLLTGFVFPPAVAPAPHKSAEPAR
jgi:parallel beta-helix repeat protein